MADPFDIHGPITVERSNGATQWMVENAPRIGTAKAEMQKADNMLRVVKSLVISASAAKTVGEREAEAYSSPEYKDAIHNLFEATREYETLRSLQTAAQAVIDVWRSMSSAQKASRV
jgi:hypothetical protein